MVDNNHDRLTVPACMPPNKGGIPQGSHLIRVTPKQFQETGVVLCALVRVTTGEDPLVTSFSRINPSMFSHSLFNAADNWCWAVKLQKYNADRNKKYDPGPKCNHFGQYLLGRLLFIKGVTWYHDILEK